MPTGRQPKLVISYTCLIIVKSQQICRKSLMTRQSHNVTMQQYLPHVEKSIVTIILHFSHI